MCWWRVFACPQWKMMTRKQQAKYYEEAKRERAIHAQLYPDWSAKDNYVCARCSSHTLNQQHELLEKKWPMSCFCQLMSTYLCICRAICQKESGGRLPPLQKVSLFLLVLMWQKPDYRADHRSLYRSVYAGLNELMNNLFIAHFFAMKFFFEIGLFWQMRRTEVPAENALNRHQRRQPI